MQEQCFVFSYAHTDGFKRSDGVSGKTSKTWLDCVRNPRERLTAGLWTNRLEGFIL